MLIILTTCLHLSNQTQKSFGKLPTPSYIDPLLHHTVLKKLSILWIPLVAFLKRKSLLFTNLCQRPFRTAQTLFYQTIEHHSYFSFFSIEEVSRLIRSLPNKSSPLNLIPTSILKHFSHLFVPIIFKLTNLSLSQALFSAFFKTA